MALASLVLSWGERGNALHLRALFIPLTRTGSSPTLGEQCPADCPQGEPHWKVCPDGAVLLR